MRAEDLYVAFQKKPFPPVQLVLRDSRRVEISARELVIVGVDFLDVGTQAANQPQGVWASRVRIPVEEVASLEPAPSRTAS